MKVKITKPKQEEKEESSSKFDKSFVLYLLRKGSNYTCSECYFYKEKKCALYGQSVNISPLGGCNLWQKGNGNEVNWINSTTKEESGYVESKEGFTCARCEYFIEDKNDCKKVNKNSKGDTPNKIIGEACCNGWEADDNDND